MFDKSSNCPEVKKVKHILLRIYDFGFVDPPKSKLSRSQKVKHLSLGIVDFCFVDPSIKQICLISQAVVNK